MNFGTSLRDYHTEVDGCQKRRPNNLAVVLLAAQQIYTDRMIENVLKIY